MKCQKESKRASSFFKEILPNHILPHYVYINDYIHVSQLIKNYV